MRFSHTVRTTAPPEEIWSLWTDVARWPDWDTELASASLDGDFGLGATGTLKPERGPASRFTIAELSPGEGYAFMIGLPLCRLGVARRLAREAGGTSFTHEVSFEGPLSFVFGALLGGRYRWALPGVMENLRGEAEGAAERSGAAP